MLVALVAALTVGTGVLLWMETAPARPTVPLPLQVVQSAQDNGMLAVVRTAQVPLQYIKWSGGSVVVHDLGRDSPAIAGGCHFLIGSAAQFGDGEVRATSRWLQQRDGNHVEVPGFSFNTNSVGICLLTDFGRSGPTARQWKGLVGLIRAIQITCEIPSDRVYLHSDLGRAGCPGGEFPAGVELRKQLIPAAR